VIEIQSCDKDTVREMEAVDSERIKELIDKIHSYINKPMLLALSNGGHLPQIASLRLDCWYGEGLTRQQEIRWQSGFLVDSSFFQLKHSDRSWIFSDGHDDHWQVFPLSRPYVTDSSGDTDSKLVTGILVLYLGSTKESIEEPSQLALDLKELAVLVDRYLIASIMLGELAEINHEVGLLNSANNILGNKARRLRRERDKVREELAELKTGLTDNKS